MDNLEKVEKIREKTGVSYEDAKNALEACSNDILDAIVYLEKLGKIKAPNTPVYSTEPGKQSQEFEKAQQSYENSCQGTSIGDVFSRFFKWCGRMIKKGCDTTFEVIKEGKTIMTIPVIVLVLSLVLAFWIAVPLLVIGLFCNCKYYFRGIEKTTVDINDMCEKASEACENIKNDIQGKE